VVSRSVKIVYPDASPDARAALGPERLRRLQAIGETVVHVGRPADPGELLRRVRDATTVLLGWDLPPEVMREARRLELVAFLGIGVGTYVDLDAARAQGITVTNTPGYADNTVAEHALGLLLALARKIPRQDAALRAGRWSPAPGVELRGRRLGLVGFGGIGRRMAELGRALGMAVSVWTPHPERHQGHPEVEFVPLERLLAESDVVSIHIAHTPETEGLLGAGELRRMAPHALLVNTARGAIVDESALLACLDNGGIAGAALDVFVTEPLPPGHPLVAHPNVVATPHAAYNTPEATSAIFELAVEAIEGFYAGRPCHVVTAPDPGGSPKSEAPDR
jgi:phosphoglycerate dehydrogenase-like enzyme